MTAFYFIARGCKSAGRGHIHHRSPACARSCGGRWQRAHAPGSRGSTWTCRLALPRPRELTTGSRELSQDHPQASDALGGEGWSQALGPLSLLWLTASSDWESRGGLLSLYIHIKV